MDVIKGMEGRHIVVDRIEGGYAVCELPTGTMENIPLKDFLFPVKEGMVLRVMEGKFQIDEEEYDKRKKEIEDLMSEMF